MADVKHVSVIGCGVIVQPILIRYERRYRVGKKPILTKCEKRIAKQDSAIVRLTPKR